MSKYYSLETLIEAKRGSFCDMYDLEDFLGEIPEEKILKITRCKDCKYFFDDCCNHPENIVAYRVPDFGKHYVYKDGIKVEADHFCSYAEPKEIEGENIIPKMI